MSTPRKHLLPQPLQPRNGRPGFQPRQFQPTSKRKNQSKRQSRARLHHAQPFPNTGGSMGLQAHEKNLATKPAFTGCGKTLLVKWFVSGHEFYSCRKPAKLTLGFSPCRLCARRHIFFAASSAQEQ